MSKRGSGEGDIRKRDDGRWEARIRFTTAGGQRKRRSAYAKTQREAIQKLAALRRQVQQGLPMPDERLTVAKYMADWLRECVAPNTRGSTYRGYEVNVRCHIVPEIGNVRLSRLTPLDVRRLLNDKLASGLSARSVRYIRATLHAALAQAERDGLVVRNVAALVKGPKVEPGEIRPLDAGQVLAFLEGVKGDRLEALYVTAFATGLRQGELLGLRWQDVDLDRRELRVVQALRIESKTLGPPKSKRSRRTLPLPAMAVTALREHRIRQVEERLRIGDAWADHGLVFTTGVGTPLDGNNVNRYFQRHLERLGLPRQRFHDVRHACASLLLAQGVPLRVVMEVLGHSQISLTADTYSHVMPALKTEAADALDRALGAG